MVIDKPTTIQECQDILRRDPDHAEVMEWAWELSQGQEGEFLNVYRDLTKSDADEPRHVRNFARTYLRLGRPLLAVVQYQKYLHARPSSEGYHELADVYRKLNRERNADEAVQKADELQKKGM